MKKLIAFLLVLPMLSCGYHIGTHHSKLHNMKMWKQDQADKKELKKQQKTSLTNL